ncbi:MAG TPA: hypothetical protein VMI33_25960 [Streptosporangiaceae bacterium]|nr:hypothetical protein [Streptosporangiaceae bacterium]
MSQDIRDTGNALIEGVTKAWGQLVQQIDELLGWSPGTVPAPGGRKPSVMADSELRAAVRGAATGLIGSVDPARQAHTFVIIDPRWRFNLPATVPAHLQHMFIEASDAFGLGIVGLDHHASSVDLAVVGRLAEILARARWLVEPADAAQRNDRGYALAEEEISDLRAAAGRAQDAGGADQSGLAGEVADRAATMAARLAELRQEDGLGEARLPKPRKLLRAYLPGNDVELFALLTAAGSRPAVPPTALFYREAGTGDALYRFQRQHLTRAYWLARATALYAGICAAAGPVLGRADWQEPVALAESRLRPLALEIGQRYQQRLQRGLHPGL